MAWVGQSDEGIAKDIERVWRDEVPVARESAGRPAGNESGTCITNRGNASADSILARLKRDNPDLAQQVINGEITANAAVARLIAASVEPASHGGDRASKCPQGHLKLGLKVAAEVMGRSHNTIRAYLNAWNAAARLTGMRAVGKHGRQRGGSSGHSSPHPNPSHGRIVPVRVGSSWFAEENIETRPYRARARGEQLASVPWGTKLGTTSVGAPCVPGREAPQGALKIGIKGCSVRARARTYPG